jgi:hypothetical protein
MADFEHYWVDFIVCPVLLAHAALCLGITAYLKYKRWPIRHPYDWSADPR